MQVDSYSCYYWSSTTLTFGTFYAWVVDVKNGIGGNTSKSYSFYVWPLRAGQQNFPDTAYPANIWKTGQTTSYYPGDDGDLEKGVAWPYPRFIDRGDGTVTDKLTGLMWTKDASLPGSSYTNWQEALDYVSGMNAGIYPNFGYKDWRIPNRKEFNSLADFSQYGPILPSGHPFINVVHNYYWSSTSYAFWTDYAYIIDMVYGNMYAGGKSILLCDMWPVRSSQLGE